MKNHTYFLITAVVFSVVAVVHFLRVMSGWEVNIGEWQLPMWLSWLALLVTGALAYHGYRLRK